MAISMNGAYFNGLDQSTTLASTLAQIPGSVTTDYILFSLNVPSGTNADITFGLSGPTLATGGKITVATTSLLVSVVGAGVAKGKCQRVWLSLGGWGSSAFTNIQQIVQTGGALQATLMSNFQAIIQALSAVMGGQTVGFDMDFEEQDSPIDTLVADVSVALYEQFKCPITFCPYQDCGAWIHALQLIYARLKTQPVVGINLQCYAGGQDNTPSQWVSALQSATETGVTNPSSFVWPILSLDPTAGPDYTPARMTTQLQSWKSPGASIWATANLSQPGSTLTAYSQALATGISG